MDINLIIWIHSYMAMEKYRQMASKLGAEILSFGISALEIVTIFGNDFSVLQGLSEPVSRCNGFIASVRFL